MRRILLGAAAMAAMLCAGSMSTPAFAQDPNDGWVEVKMSYCEDDKELDKIVTPDPQFTKLNNDVKNYFPLFDSSNKKGRLCTVKELRKVTVDSDDDGSMETEFNKMENLVKFKVTYTDGKVRPYQAKFYQDDKEIKWLNNEMVPNWKFKRACYYKGTAMGEQIIVIDDDNNGKYDDLDKDVLVVGKSTFGCFLGKAVLLKDKLYQLKIDESGDKVFVKEADPTLKTGQIDFKTKYKHAKLKPQAVIISSKSGYSFNAITSKAAATVPVGEYTIVFALFTERIWAKTGKSSPIKVEEGKTFVVEWGGPYSLVSDPFVEISGEVFSFTPPSQLTAPRRDPVDVEKYKKIPFVKMKILPVVYGAFGEEYYGAPKFKDGWGFCFPDESVKQFGIEILPVKEDKGVKPGASGAQVKASGNSKPLNKTTNNSEHECWHKIDMSGLVQKQPDYWEHYQCPIENYRGKVQFRIWLDNSIFGKIEETKQLNIP